MVLGGGRGRGKVEETGGRELKSWLDVREGWGREGRGEVMGG